MIRRRKGMKHLEMKQGRKVGEIIGKISRAF
jgi:hypothetical protein